MSRYDLTVLRSRADDVTLRPGTVVPMPTSPRAEQSRTRAGTRHASGARKITDGQRAHASAKRTVQAVASGPPAPHSHRARLPWPTSRSARIRPAARAAKATKRRPLGATFVVAVRLRPFAATRPSPSSVTGGSLRHRWPGSGPHAARSPGGLKDDCQSGSLDRQVNRRIKWRRTCQPRPCLSACRTASQPSYS
jgi:hypothetical protein